MAGLTREQRAERARLKSEAEGPIPVEAKPQGAEVLIAMVKDGETTFVHPSCVKSHQSVGWALEA